MPSRPILQAWANTVGPSADVLVETQAGGGTPQHRDERGLARFERFAPQVVAVQLDEVEGVQEHPVVMAAVADPVEARHAVVIATHGLAVDEERGRKRASDSTISVNR